MADHHHQHGSDQQHGGHEPGHGEHQHHGHQNDQGLKGMVRYLRFAPRMWRSDLNRAVIDLLSPAPGERVLDIGAGMGPGTVRAAKAGASVVAVEPTPFLRRILSLRRLFQRARDNIAVVDGSAEKLPTADGSIDALWAVNTMHHWVDPEQGVAEIGRVLRPGGRLVLVDEDFEDPEHPDFDRFKDQHEDGDQEEGHHHGFAMVGPAQMGEMLAKQGLVGIQADKRWLSERPVIAVIARAAAPEDQPTG